MRRAPKSRLWRPATKAEKSPAGDLSNGTVRYFAVGIVNSGPLGVASGQRSMMDFCRV
jgi:hypothetical protein